ncbi:hypothetical protein ANN_09747 [Periplaneta americana]|uniref:Uncharacterized protein n=1 Tax=Periplaneta americana TaxID=6978 RepID=A0ABQ8TQ56_PERAM|nr:hypothetical protein ANN_09747 [Periplaneta americana]
MGESRNAYRVLIGKPEGKRPLGRPRRRWEDNIKMDLREMGYDDRDWINLAQDRDRWRAYVRAAMNLRKLVVPPLVAIRAATMSGMLSTSLCEISTGMRRHSFSNMTLSWTMEVGRISRDLNHRPVQPVNIILCIPLHSSRRNMGPTSIVQLSAMLQEEWRRIPVDILHKLVESKTDRVAAVIATRDGTTRFQRGKNSAQLLFGR